MDDESMQRLYLIHCKSMVHILLCMKDPIKRIYIKKATKLWSSGTPNVRIDAFMFLHELGKRMHGDNNEDNKTSKEHYLENKDLLLLFKYMYQGYVTVCKRVSPSTMPGINFMMNCMTEMYALNPVITYKDAFKRLRSIAFHVKQAIQIMAKHQTKNVSTKELRAKKLKQAKLETVQSVYNWRFINIIRLWAKVLGSHANRKNSDIHLLYYPFIQIACSVLTLSRSAMYDPGRLKIMSSLCDLIKVCQKSTIMDRRIFVPLAPYLISIINNPAFGKKTKSQKKNKKKVMKNAEKKEDEDENERKWDIHYKIKVGDNDFNTEYLHKSLMNNAVKMMIMYFNYYSYSIAFPEIAFPTQVFLREFGAKGNVPQELKAGTKILSQKLRENSNWITAKRKNVQFSPKDFEKVHAFLAAERLRDLSPLSKFVKSKQFEMMDEDGLDGNMNNKQRNKNKNKNQKKKILSAEEQRVLKRKEKKQRKKMERFKKRKKEEKEQKDLKIKEDLLNKYMKDKKSNKGELTGLGDIVQDFELSDDDE